MTRAPLSPDYDGVPDLPPPVNGAFAWGVRLFLIGMALILGIGWWLS